MDSPPLNTAGIVHDRILVVVLAAICASVILFYVFAVLDTSVPAVLILLISLVSAACFMNVQAGFLILLIAISTASWTIRVESAGYPNVENMIVAAAMLCMVIRLALSRRKLVVQSWHWALAAFAVIALVSGWFAFTRFSTFGPIADYGFLNISNNIWGVPSGSVRGNILETSTAYAVWAGLLFVASQLEWTPRFRRDLMLTIGAVLVLNTGAVALQAAVHPSAFGGSEVLNGRQSGLMTNFNALGHTAALLLTLFPLWAERSRRGFIIGAGIAATALFCVLFGGSRAPLLQILFVAAGAMLLLIKNREWSKKQAWIASLSALLILVLFAGLFFSGALSSFPLIQRIEFQLSGAGTLGQFLNARADMWPNALAMIATNPLAGFGSGTFFVDVGNISASLGRPLGVVDNALNLYLNVGAELGLLALALLVFVLIAVLMQRHSSSDGKAAPWRRQYAQVVLAAMLLTLMLGPHILNVSTAMAFWLLAGFVAARNPEAKPKQQPALWRHPVVLFASVALALAAMLVSNASLDRYNQWKQYRWHIDANFYPPESTDDPSFWTGDLAVQSLVPTNRYLCIKWKAGDPSVAETKPSVTFSWDGSVIDQEKVDDGSWRYTIIDTGPAQVGQRLLEIRTTPAWVPGEYFVGSGDMRRLGIRIGEFAEVDEPHFIEDGFWSWEVDGAREFQWSKRESVRTVPLQRGPLRFAVRAPHADVAEKPVTVTMRLNAVVVQELALSIGEWHEVVIEPGALSSDDLPDWHPNLRDSLMGVLIISVDRTWRPSDFGGSFDNRELGVAVTQVELVNAHE